MDGSLDTQQLEPCLRLHGQVFRNRVQLFEGCHHKGVGPFFRVRLFQGQGDPGVDGLCANHNSIGKLFFCGLNVFWTEHRCLVVGVDDE